MDLYLESEDLGIKFNLQSFKFEEADNTTIVKYLKGVYRNKERFTDRFLNRCKEGFTEIKKVLEENNLNPSEYIKQEYNDFQEIFKDFDTIEPLSFKEAFEVEDSSFRAFLFKGIDIEDMITNCGYTEQGTENVRGVDYTLCKVNGEKLEIEDTYAIKCSCPSTKKTHFIWIESEFAKDPITGIASCYRVPENQFENISQIVRHGDVVLYKKIDASVESSPNLKPITKDMYISLVAVEA